MADEILIERREKDNAKALCVKAEAMYNLGNFEHALLCFYNALRRSNVKVIIIEPITNEYFPINYILSKLHAIIILNGTLLFRIVHSF